MNNTETSKLIKASAYLRYSDKKQDGNNSLAIQKSQIQVLAEREKLDITNWRADKATSAFRSNISKREGIQLIFEDIANGAEAICFYEESRITRSITDFYNEVYTPIKLQYPHVKFFSTHGDGEWNPDDPIVQAKLVFAAEESEIKSVRTIDAQGNLLNREQPKRPGSRTPVGYDMKHGVLHPNDDAIVVELIYYLASWGHSHSIIAQFLNKSAITTIKVKNWNSSTIGYILSNRAYSGNLSWNVRTSYEISKPKPERDIELFKNVHSPIISTTVIHLVKQINDLKERLGTMNTPFYLRSIIKCKSCNTCLIAKDHSPKGKPGAYRIYKCLECNNSVPILPAHEAVLNDLLKKWNTQLDTISTTSRKQLKQWSTKLKKTKDSLKQQRELVFLNEKTLADDIINSSLLRETFLTAKRHLENEITYISESMDEIELLIKDDYLIITLKEILNHSFYDFSDTELRVFLLLFFDEVQINFEKNNEIQISYRLSPFVSLEKSTGYVTEKMQ
ncbi:recombinase family protein [Lysinibacillus sp. NPDC095746]|uniref:recombinase family protein n=1 Tax=Lysinibacillus sp. NPDC095746 TaxID=3364134 RepID=UPI0037FD557C